MKPIAAGIVVIVALLLGVSGTNADASSGAPVVETKTVSFHMSSATCTHLPTGASIDGTGTQVSITLVTTDHLSVKTIRNSTTVTGTATDQSKNSYAFQYANQFTISNTRHAPDDFSGEMTDLFVLAGNGPAFLDNGFVANLTTNADVTRVSKWKVHQSHGDPIIIENGEFVAHCDPL
jgi:hypothetical protein